VVISYTKPKGPSSSRASTFPVGVSLYYVDQMDTRAPEAPHAAVDQQITALYQAHALSLARLALLMLGDRDAAQDVVQDAFLGLYRRWDKLASADAAPAYLRASVLNGCRSLLKRRSLPTLHAAEASMDSAEAALMHTEQQRAMFAAIRRLPARQRETLVLRYYLDMSEDQAARVMGVSRGTVKAATSRAIAAIGRMLKEES
jgi:RNA polymerase sigma-70 factor (sigma-E family)